MLVICVVGPCNFKIFLHFVFYPHIGALINILKNVVSKFIISVNFSQLFHKEKVP